MGNLLCTEYQLGRRFIGRLPHGADLIKTIDDFCKENQIFMATFSIIGAVSSLTLGAYDQDRKTYVTFKKSLPYEIVSCNGNISLKDGQPFVHAHAAMSDEKGVTIAGHLFSETIIFA